MITVIALVVGFFMGTSQMAKDLVTNGDTIKVGDCVRELGNPVGELVTAIVADGSIETEYRYTFDEREVKTSLHTYPNAGRLIKTKDITAATNCNAVQSLKETL